MVADGRVRVDGVVENRRTAKIHAGQVVECGDARLLVRAAQAPA
jgi:ribosome-associated protein